MVRFHGTYMGHVWDGHGLGNPVGPCEINGKIRALSLRVLCVTTVSIYYNRAATAALRSYVYVYIRVLLSGNMSDQR